MKIRTHTAKDIFHGFINVVTTKRILFKVNTTRVLLRIVKLTDVVESKRNRKEIQKPRRPVSYIKKRLLDER